LSERIPPAAAVAEGPNGASKIRLIETGVVRLFDADPELARHLPAQFMPLARRQAIAEGYTLPRGSWSPLEDPSVRDTQFGFVVLSGVIARRVMLIGRRSVELLGEGDLIRPQQPDDDPYAVVPQRANWSVLAEAKLALLDGDLITGLAPLPGVLPEMAARAVQRSRRLALQLAIAQVPALEGRLELLLWHLADRWGRREGGEVVLPVRLPQGLLADLICAQRTSVNAAIKQLVAQGTLRSCGVGQWVLRGEPPGHLLAQIEDDTDLPA